MLNTVAEAVHHPGSGFTLGHLRSGQRIRFHCDSLPIVQAWANQSSKHPWIMELLRTLFFHSPAILMGPRGEPHLWSLQCRPTSTTVGVQTGKLFHFSILDELFHQEPCGPSCGTDWDMTSPITIHAACGLEQLLQHFLHPPSNDWTMGQLCICCLRQTLFNTPY